MAHDGGGSITYNFEPADYAIVLAALGFTAIVGAYHIWKASSSSSSSSSPGTSRDDSTGAFLLTNRSLGLLPLVLSAAATALSSGNLLVTPMQGYANGMQLMLGYVAFFLGRAVTAYTTLPVFYGLEVNTVNQYIEYRFNRFLRIFPAFIGIAMQSFTVAGITYLTALIFTQATGIPIGTSIILLGGVCILYSSLGGFMAVIWTDVFQIVIIFATYALMAIKGTVDAGGMNNIWEKNDQGNRTTLAYFSPVPHSGYTIWSLMIGEFAISFCIQCNNQAALQRLMSNRTITGARRTIFITAVITETLSIVSVWIGMAAYARYFRCDPVLTGHIESKDQIVAHFAMDMFRGIPGLSGLYVAGILCATLSTLSSIINSFAAVALIDFIKPLMPETPDQKCKRLAKLVGLFYGLFIMAMSTVSKYFGNLVAVMHAIGGSALGTASGIYVLGFFFPWATTKGTIIGYFASLIFGWWLSIGRMLIGNPYIMAPVSADGCNATTPSSGQYLNSTTLSPPEVPVTKIPDAPYFPLHNIIPIWYAAITLGITVIVGMVASIATGSRDLDNLNPNLISPFTMYILRMLPRDQRKRWGLAKFLADDAKFMAPNQEYKETDLEPEAAIELVDKCHWT